MRCRGRGWQGIGLARTQSAGFASSIHFHERPSQAVLPELDAQGLQVDFAFIDGWHTFDHALVDFSYVDRILRVGGVVVIDDVGYPAINSLVRFILANRSYELVEVLHLRARPMIWRAREFLERGFQRFARLERTPGKEHDQLFRRFANAHCVAIRKLGGDDRRWDHFAPF